MREILRKGNNRNRRSRTHLFALMTIDFFAPNSPICTVGRRPSQNTSRKIENVEPHEHLKEISWRFIYNYPSIDSTWHVQIQRSKWMQSRHVLYFYVKISTGQFLRKYLNRIQIISLYFVKLLKMSLMEKSLKLLSNHCIWH